MDLRDLQLDSYAAARAEIERLASTPHTPRGNWNLAQTCHHLAYWYRGSLGGFDFKAPWLVRATIGRFFLGRLLKKGVMRPGLPTAPGARPPDDVDPSAVVAECLDLLAQLETHPGPLHPSPLFGELTPDQWRRLHLIHTTLHLRLLEPQA